MKDFVSLSLEIPIQLLFFLFLFPSYSCSVDSCVLSISITEAGFEKLSP